jgi:organic radical activating enzyme
MSIDSISTTWQDYPNNSDLSLIVFFNGCELGCNNCQNKTTLKNDKKDLFNKDKFNIILKEELNKYKTNKLVLSGGDPLYKDNIEITRQILESNLNIDICVYTGYDIEYVKSNNIVGAKFYKCGFYDDNNRDYLSGKTNEYLRLASTNQRIYNYNYELVSKNNIYYF